MKKLIFIVILAIATSCASTKGYDYKSEGKPGVRYKKAHKQELQYVDYFIIAFFVGFFVVSENNTGK